MIKSINIKNSIVFVIFIFIMIMIKSINIKNNIICVIIIFIIIKSLDAFTSNLKLGLNTAMPNPKLGRGRFHAQTPSWG